MRFVSAEPRAIWRQRLSGAFASFVLYIVLYFIGVLKLDDWALAAQFVSAAVCLVGFRLSPSSGWAWVLSITDVVTLFLVIRATGGTSSPFQVMVPVWLFGVALTTVRGGIAQPLWLVAILGLIGVLAGGYGFPNFKLYVVVQLIAISAAAAGAYTLTLEREEGRTDPLLPMLLNRRAGLEQLEAWVQGGTRFTLAFVDLGEFKSINDRLGHKIGDEVLFEVGTRLKRSVGRGDLVARYGGDEFLVAVRSDDTLECHSDPLEASVPTSAGEVLVRADVGTVRFERSGNLDALLERADGAMYERKRTFKPRTSVA
jgi:diguanylate cyclase (GGDEF)-like protein